MPSKKTEDAVPVANEKSLNAPEEVESEGNFFTQMENLLSKLIPPDNVVINTCAGKAVTIAGAIPARRQVKVFRHMKELLEIDSVALAFGSLSSGVDMGSIMNTVIALATDEEIAEKIGDIFKTAYPNASGDEHPLDVFAIEELVVALVPFSARFLKRVGSGVMTIGKSANKLD